MPYDFGTEAELTDSQLAGELAKLSPPTKEQLQALLPSLEDQGCLDQILTVVNSAASSNQKASRLLGTIAELTPAAKAALTKFLVPGSA